ncbi:MAG: hypothetical protein AAB506_02830 [Patescibacteria group bacterium]
MIDFKFEDIACWICQPVDPIALENWAGNKLLGVKVEENKEWEKAFKKWEAKDLKGADDKETMELILDGTQPEGIVKIGDLGTVVCPAGEAGPAEIRMDNQKILVGPDEILILSLATGTTSKIKIKLKSGWKEAEVEGGKVGLVIDTRGRPMVKPTVDTIGRERLLKWQKARI